jgi:hypothetical protein
MFSGGGRTRWGERTGEKVYVLNIDRIVLSNEKLPKADGLPISAEKASDGACRAAR